MVALPTFGDEGGHDGIDVLNGKKGVEAGYIMEWPDDLEPVLLYYGSLRLLLELTSHCPLGQLWVAMLQPYVLVKGSGVPML